LKKDLINRLKKDLIQNIEIDENCYTDTLTLPGKIIMCSKFHCLNVGAAARHLIREHVFYFKTLASKITTQILQLIV